MTKNNLLLLMALSVTAFFAGPCLAGYRTLEVPVLQGDWWQISEREPDVSPYNTAEHNACDFSIWQDDVGDWHLVSCIRSTSHPGATRLFHAWESPSLTNTMWDSSVFTNTFDTGSVVTVTNGLFAVSQTNLNQYPGVMQAPHCFKENGLYYFFYNAAYNWDSRQGNGAWLKTSVDGSTHSFTNAVDYQGNDTFFTMGRDVMVFDNRAEDGLWYASYTGKPAGMTEDGVVGRSASSLEGPWGDAFMLNDTGNPESPFIIKRGDWYYLWQQSEVRASQTVTNFMSPMVTDMGFGLKWAPEVVELDGQEYIACYGNGIHVSKFGWVTKEVSDADIVYLTGNFDEPAFDSTNTVYLGTELKSVSTVSYRFRTAQVGATATATVFNASNPFGAGIGITLIPGHNRNRDTDDIPLEPGENRIEIQITAEDGQQKTYVIFVNRQNSDNSYDSFITPLNLYPHVREADEQQIGIRLSANPGSTKVVTVEKISGDNDLTLANGTTNLTFTTGNWDEPQFVTVRAALDTDGIENTALFRCSASGLGSQDIVATEREESAQRIITTVNSLQVPEGSNSTFDVRLTQAPTGNVEVAVGRASGDEDLTALPTNLTFTTITWSNWQTVTVSAAPDPDSVSSSTVFRCSSSGLENKDITAHEVDDDFPDIVVSTNALDVPEGSSAIFNVKLTGDPGGSWTVNTARIGGDTHITVSDGDSLEFDSGSWDVYQPVTLSAAEDPDIVNGVATVRCSAVSMESVDVIATEAENDGLQIMLSTNAITVPEGGNNTFGIKLNGDPITPRTVTVSRASGDSHITVSDGSPLVLDSGNWDSYKTVTLTASEDPDSTSDDAFIECTSPGLTTKNLTATEIDNDGPVTFFSELMDTDPGWSASGSWAFGEPAWANSDGYGSSGATSAYSGTDVYAYNLTGDYENALTVTNWLTTTAIDCSDYSSITLTFQRWLGIERNTFDHASLQVSSNGTDWIMVWENSTSTIDDSAWGEQQYDLSATADGQTTVYLRWGIGITDSSWQYSGWALDDIELTGDYVGNDADSDGLPDDWETLYYGGTHVDPSAMCSNGINTVLQAYIAGLNPTNSDSCFLITNLAVSSPSVINWNGVSGRVYTIYWTSNLLSGFGAPLETNVTGGAFTDSTHGAENTGFYKLDVQIEE